MELVHNSAFSSTYFMGKVKSLLFSHHPFLPSFLRSFIHSFTHSFIHSFTRLYICLIVFGFIGILNTNRQAEVHSCPVDREVLDQDRVNKT